MKYYTIEDINLEHRIRINRTYYYGLENNIIDLFNDKVDDINGLLIGLNDDLLGKMYNIIALYYKHCKQDDKKFEDYLILSANLKCIWGMLNLIRCNILNDDEENDMLEYMISTNTQISHPYFILGNKLLQSNYHRGNTDVDRMEKASRLIYTAIELGNIPAMCVMAICLLQSCDFSDARKLINMAIEQRKCTSDEHDVDWAAKFQYIISLIDTEENRAINEHGYVPKLTKKSH